MIQSNHQISQLNKEWNGTVQGQRSAPLLASIQAAVSAGTLLEPGGAGAKIAASTLESVPFGHNTSLAPSAWAAAPSPLRVPNIKCVNLPGARSLWRKLTGKKTCRFWSGEMASESAAGFG
jgi:hypothetical protein